MSNYKGIQVSLNERPLPFSKEDNYEIAEIHGQNLLQKLGQFHIKLATEYLWVKGIQGITKTNKTLLKQKQQRNCENTVMK